MQALRLQAAVRGRDGNPSRREGGPRQRLTRRAAATPAHLVERRLIARARVGRPYAGRARRLDAWRGCEGASLAHHHVACPAAVPVGRVAPSRGAATRDSRLGPLATRTQIDSRLATRTQIRDSGPRGLGASGLTRSVCSVVPAPRRASTTGTRMSLGD